MSKYCFLFLFIYLIVSILVSDWVMNCVFINFFKMFDYFKVGCEGKVMIWIMVFGFFLWFMDYGLGLWVFIFIFLEVKFCGVNYSFFCVYV